jgi:hypothetical protein
MGSNPRRCFCCCSALLSLKVARQKADGKRKDVHFNLSDAGELPA